MSKGNDLPYRDSNHLNIICSKFIARELFTRKSNLFEKLNGTMDARLVQ